MVIGITGGVSSGKSEASKYIENLGFKIINTDNIAKDIIKSNEKVKQKIIDAFGEKSFIDSKLNNSYISSLVFGNNEKAKSNLNLLNTITHPEVITQMIDQIEQSALEGYHIIFVESALIFESNLEDGFDYIIMIDTKDELRQKRFIERTNSTAEDFINRNKSQISTQYKKENSDFIIDNNTTISNLHKSLDKLIEIIKILPKRENN